MSTSRLSDRRIRARKGDDDDDEVFDQTSSAESAGAGEPGEEHDDSDDENMSGEGVEEEEEEDDDDEESESDDPAQDAKAALSDISFGALAKAQAQVPIGKRKRPSISKEDEKIANRRALEDVRNKLLALREEKAKERAKDGNFGHKRSSKHAPTVMSSTHAVTRKRTVVEPLPTPKVRDPRFDSAVLSNGLPRSVGAMGSAAEAARQRYSFLDGYRSDEIAALRKQIAQTKNPDEKEELKRQITSMSDRLRSHKRKDVERRIRAEHKKKERELIREGKKSKAYYLKDSEVKKQAQVARFKEMSGRQKQKALEHRRKKIASKESKDMPWARRSAEDT
ncbi:rRNA biogenesis protein rrp36 [Ascosphaera pollenicola]|nr:rRNA biogenesis protein rrp36 [Ascosphaera pollenicola]